MNSNAKKNIQNDGAIFTLISRESGEVLDKCDESMTILLRYESVAVQNSLLHTTNYGFVQIRKIKNSFVYIVPIIK